MRDELGTRKRTGRGKGTECARRHSERGRTRETGAHGGAAHEKGNADENLLLGGVR
jgi:hypothetical protein